MSDIDKIEENTSTIDEIFAERDAAVPEKMLDEDISNEIDKKPAEIKKDSDKKEDKDVSDYKDTKEIVEKTEKKSPEKKIEEDVDDEKYAEVSNLKKALNDSKKWGHTSNKRLKSAVKMVNELKDQGALTDDEFSKLSEFLTSDVEEEQMTPVDTDPLSKLIKTANKRLDDLQAIYEEDPLFMKKAQAFDFFVKHASDSEKEYLLDELSEFEDNDIKLAKRMYKIGEKYYEENYKEVEAAGGLKELLSLKNTEIEKMQRKLDKLERNLSSLEDYDKPNYKIDELGETGNAVEGKPGSTIDEIFEERDRKKR